jgi:hypothetical protein
MTKRRDPVPKMILVGAQIQHHIRVIPQTYTLEPSMTVALSIDRNGLLLRLFRFVLGPCQQDFRDRAMSTVCNVLMVLERSFLSLFSKENHS